MCLCNVLALGYHFNLLIMETTINSIGTMIDIEAKAKHCREFSVVETKKQLYFFGKIKVFSWGAHNWVNFQNKALRFTVQGRHFRGHVYIFLNGADLYDVYYCSNRGNIKMIDTDMYFDQLTEIIDRKVEYVPEYKNN
jgi:hypothetical protein